MEPSAKRRSLRLIMTVLVSLAIIGGLAYFLFANSGVLLGVLRVSLSGVLALFALSLTFPVINGLINTYLFRGLGADLSHREGFLIAAAGNLANQLPLPGGIVARGVYLKHRHGLSYASYLSSQLALFICNVAMDGAIGLGVLLVWFLRDERGIQPLLVAGFAAMTLTAATLLVPVPARVLPAILGERQEQALAGWRSISTNPPLLIRLLGLQLAAVVLLAGRYWLAFHMLSQAVAAGQVLLFAAASVLTQLVGFVPGDLGVREAIVGVVASAVGFALPIGVAAVALDRLIVTFTNLAIGWISTVLLARQVSAAPTQGSAGGA